MQGSGHQSEHAVESNDDDDDDSLLQSGSGLLKRPSAEKEDFISKVATLVSERLKSDSTPQARPVYTNWSNFNLSPPGTSVIGTTNTTPPIHYNQPRIKNNEDDIFGRLNLFCFKLIIIFLYVIKLSINLKKYLICHRWTKAFKANTSETSKTGYDLTEAI